MNRRGRTADTSASLDETLRNELRCSDASTDYGGVEHALPAAVFTPRSSHELSALLSEARLARKTVVVRGAGHSQGGQCLNPDGYVVSTHALSEVEPVDVQARSVVVGAGARWAAVLEQTLPLGLIPPVLTDHLQVSVGGTLAVGGVGPSSFRQGLQLHHCDAAEVVFGSGQIRWLTKRDEPELFSAVLGGLGRLGVITRARLLLRPACPFVHVAEASYERLEAFLSDVSVLLHSEQPTHLAGAALQSSRSDTDGRRFVVRVGIESSARIAPTMKSLLGGLQCTRSFAASEPVAVHTRRFDRTFASERYRRSSKLARPWVEYVLPLGAVPAYLESVTRWFPDTGLLLWPLLAERMAWPSFALPSAAELMMVGLLIHSDCAGLPRVCSNLERAAHLAESLGGKRYLSGWVGFDDAAWARHYGSYWSRRQQLRALHDPHGVLRELPRRKGAQSQ